MARQTIQDLIEDLIEDRIEKRNLNRELISRLQKNVMRVARTRRTLSKKRNLLSVNEHIETVFNAVLASAIVFQQSVRQVAREGLL